MAPDKISRLYSRLFVLNLTRFFRSQYLKTLHQPPKKSQGSRVVEYSFICIAVRTIIFAFENWFIALGSFHKDQICYIIY